MKRVTDLYRPSFLRTLLIALIIVPFIDASFLSTPVRVQAALLAFANQQPTKQVKLIVQRLGYGAEAEKLVAHLGGRVTDELSIINAFVAELPAQAALALGRSPAVRWVSLDSTMQSSQCSACISTTNLASAYTRTINADKVWNRSPNLQGQGIGVAIVDSGVQPQQDFYTVSGQNRLVTSVAFNSGYNLSPNDGYGHGNHVAGIIGSNGSRSNGAYIGVAPAVNLINVKVSDDAGVSTISNVVKGLQWIFDNQNRYNIRVVNLSLNDSVLESYHTSALDAAVEVLWFNRIVVVVSAGNTGNGGIYAPANDPFVITVGATDDRGTGQIADDVLASFSAYGNTVDGFAKPDLVAPGKNIISQMGNTNCALATAHPDHVITLNGASYLRMSGTSMAAPMVSGAAALLLQANPNLTPDQIKHRLTATAKPFDTSTRAGAGYLNVEAAVSGTTTQKANQNIPTSRLLWGNNTPLVWNSLTENSVSWRPSGSAFWGTVSSNSDLNNSTTWSSDYWGN